MTKNIGLVWLKDDFRLKRNLALTEATKNHDQVVTFFLYKKKKFDDQEAQKWWVSESIQEFKKKLINYNINLEVIATDTYKSFFEKLFQKKNFSIYWNKTYEPNYLKFDEFLKTNFEKNQIKYSIFKGNVLNEFNEVKKNDGTPFKVFTPFWRNAEKYYMEKIPTKEKKEKISKTYLKFLNKIYKKEFANQNSQLKVTLDIISISSWKKLRNNSKSQ